MMNPFLVLAMALISSFGSWKSPITTDLIVQESIAFSDMGANDEALYFTELHPKEKGRVALVSFDGEETPLLPEISVRTRVHEYGGGAFSVEKDSIVISNDEDRQLYRFKNGKLTKLTNAPNCRYADGNNGYFVVEEHGEKVENYLSFVNEDGVKTVHTGHDFYACPRVSPDGKKLSFMTWDFPNMPWDGSTLWLADREEDGTLQNVEAIAGGNDESICQIQWSPNGILHFASDKTGYWNLYTFENGKIESLCPMEAEFGTPHWVFGRPSYAFLPDGDLITVYTIKGRDHLGRLDPKTKTLTDLKLAFSLIHSVVFYKGKVYFFGASELLPLSLIAYDPNSNTFEIIKQSFHVSASEEWLSIPEEIKYPSMNGKTGYGFYYPPKNPNYNAKEKEKPPIIINCHGGPTAQAYPHLSLKVQYWTSRGFGYLDVNYGGSTGYGREYFKRLEKTWGILDVYDATSAANTLVERGLADPKKLIIRGGSAGGYTTLAALTQNTPFAAGASYYGISDLEMLYDSDHKFESKYTDLLVAPFPERVDIIRERSPIHFIDRFTRPVLLLQGEEDKVVPPNQSEKIFEALKAKGTPVGMLLFEGEGHGFRKAANIKKALDAELFFYSKVFGFQLGEEFEEDPVEIFGKRKLV